jgi:hypothetical protein
MNSKVKHATCRALHLRIRIMKSQRLILAVGPTLVDESLNNLEEFS